MVVSYRALALAVIFQVYFVTISTAQDSYCNVTSKSVEEVLYSRVDNPSEYATDVTTGVSFLLASECDSALSYFRSAYLISPAPALLQAMNELSGTSAVPPAALIVQEPASKEVAAAKVTIAKEEPPAPSNPVEAPVLAESSTLVASAAVKSFSPEDLDAFQSKGLMKVKRLTEYFNIIVQKTTPQNTAQNTIQSALGLFDSEDHTVEVSNLNRAQKNRYPVRTYLNRLRMLNYQRVSIEAANFTYVSTFRKGPDGNYYGIARFRQAFTGYRDDKPVYSDVTTKTVGVVLKPYQKAMEGESVENWDVFLGDISVAQTEK